MTPSPTPTPSVIASLAAPEDVAANIVDRELVVSWSPVAGAASYKVAARLANGVEPFEWSEYDADAPPYVIADKWAAMSGLEYEVRAASVNADGRSEWSPAVMVVAPELRAAPAGAILVRGPGHPYAVGDLVQVGLTLPSFSRRSRYVWSVCEMDGSRCELLPHVARGSSKLSAPEAARGKRVQVQVDYNADGISYTALADAGVVNPEEGPRPPFLRPSLPDGARTRPRLQKRTVSGRRPSSPPTCTTQRRIPFTSVGIRRPAERSSRCATTCSSRRPWAVWLSCARTEEWSGLKGRFL